LGPRRFNVRDASFGGLFHVWGTRVQRLIFFGRQCAVSHSLFFQFGWDIISNNRYSEAFGKRFLLVNTLLFVCNLSARKTFTWVELFVFSSFLVQRRPWCVCVCVCTYLIAASTFFFVYLPLFTTLLLLSDIANNPNYNNQTISLLLLPEKKSIVQMLLPHKIRLMPLPSYPTCTHTHLCCDRSNRPLCIRILLHIHTTTAGQQVPG
jgi:hypothetical protein